MLITSSIKFTVKQMAVRWHSFIWKSLKHKGSSRQYKLAKPPVSSSIHLFFFFRCPDLINFTLKELSFLKRFLFDFFLWCRPDPNNEKLLPKIVIFATLNSLSPQHHNLICTQPSDGDAEPRGPAVQVGPGKGP